MTINQPEFYKEIFAALSKAQGEFKSVPKNKEVKKTGFSKKTGKEFSYSYFYADLDSIVEMVRPVLANNGLGFTQTILDDRKICVTRVFHKSGQIIETGCPILLDQGDMQSLGGNITYAKRYCLTLALGLSMDDDIDANDEEVKIVKEPFSVSNRQPNKQEQVQTEFKDPAPMPPSGNVRAYSGPSEAQLKRLYAIANSSGWPRGMADAWVKRSYEKKPSELTRSEYDATCDALKATKFNDILKEELKPFMPIDIKAQFEAEKKKQSSYVDHVKPYTEPKPFSDDESIPF